MATANAEIGGGPGLLFDLRGKDRLFRKYGGLIEDAVSWSLTGLSREDVEEVVSVVWLKLYAEDCSRLKSFAGRNGASFATWLVRVARNAAMDYLRRRPAGRAVAVDDAAGGLPDGEPGLLERMVARETRKEVVLALRSLPRIYRRVVYARFYRDWSVPATAAAFGIDEDTVYVRLSRAYARLRSTLERKELVALRTSPVRAPLGRFVGLLPSRSALVRAGMRLLRQAALRAP